MANKLKLKKGDTVVVIAGREKGKRGTITKVIPAERRVLIGGINMVKRHEKPGRANPQGGITAKEAPLHISNVALADPNDGKPSRVGYTTLADGKKARVAKHSGEVLHG